CPAFAEVPIPLRVLGDAVDVVVLVAAELADHAQGIADEVLVAQAVLALVVAAGAQHELVAAAGQFAAMGPARIEAAIAGGRCHHAAGLQRVLLRAGWNRQVLHDAALAVVGEEPQLVAAVERLLIDRTELGLPATLARVVWPATAVA